MDLSNIITVEGSTSIQCLNSVDLAQTVPEEGQHSLLIVLSDHGLCFMSTVSKTCTCTAELQRLEHIWNHENMFETGVVQANEC